MEHNKAMGQNNYLRECREEESAQLLQQRLEENVITNS